MNIPGKQRRYLDGMDLDMNEGIELNGEIITSVDKTQRANYVAMHLFYAIKSNIDGMIAATCAYLANRLPDLKKVCAVEYNEEITLDLIFNTVNKCR